MTIGPTKKTTTRVVPSDAPDCELCHNRRWLIWLQQYLDFYEQHQTRPMVQSCQHCNADASLDPPILYLPTEEDSDS